VGWWSFDDFPALLFHYARFSWVFFFLIRGRQTPLGRFFRLGCWGSTCSSQVNIGPSFIGTTPDDVV
jgi:hypothetical protein